MTESCFIAKLGHYIDLSQDDREKLAGFEKEERPLAAGQQALDAGESIEHIHVVKEGWVVSYTLFPDGRRQNIRAYLPGDIMGLSGIAYDHATIHVEAVTEATLCPFPKERVATLIRESPRLTALFFTLAMRDKVALRDTIRMLGRMQAEDRLAHFLLDVQARLRIGSDDPVTRFRMPMSQTMIADVLGISFVSVNRAFRDLEQGGDIARHGREVEIVAEAAMAERGDFHDRYDRIDTAWFPEG